MNLKQKLRPTFFPASQFLALDPTALVYASLKASSNSAASKSIDRRFDSLPLAGKDSSEETRLDSCRHFLELCTAKAIRSWR